MSLENWHSLFLILIWGGTFLVAVGSFGSWKTSDMITAKKNQQISALETQVQNLEPRVLSVAQQKKLLNKLKTYTEAKRVGFYSKMSDRESFLFAEVLAGVFKKAG